MSEINLEITPASFTTDITVSTNTIEITPNAIALNIFAAGYACAAGNTNEVQYNNGGILNGNPGLLYYPGNTRLISNNITINNNANLGAIGNIIITGGNNNQYIKTDGNGNLSFATVDTSFISNGNSNVKVYANSDIAISSAGNANIVIVNGTGANITGTLDVTNITSNGNINFSGPNVTVGDVSNLKITGGNNGTYLQTDGTGNLAWVVGGGSGNGVVGGANTQIQYNDAGLFGGSTGFTFDKSTNAMAAPGNVTVSGTVIGNVQGPVINLAYGIEKVNLIGAQTGTYNFDLITNSIQYSTSNATANLTINFRGNSTVTANTLTANGSSIIGTYIMTTGTTAYGIGNVQIDGVAQTIKWVNGATPTYVSNTVTAYTFTLIKTATTPTYTVFGTATRYS